MKKLQNLSSTKRWIFISCLFWVSSLQQIRAEVVELTRTERTQEAGSGARQAIVDRAIEGASLQLITEIIGAEKAEKNKTLISQKIIKNASRYVQSIKTGAARNTQDGLEMEVRLRLATENLEKLLLSEGLLYRLDGAPKILPLISLADRISGQSLVWWMGESISSDQDLNGLQVGFDNFIGSFRTESMPKGFFVLNPFFTHSNQLVPEVYRTESLPKEDFLWLSDFYASQVLIRGEIALDRDADRSDRSRLNFRLLALQAKNGRVIGEVVRSFVIETSSKERVFSQKLAEFGPQVAQDLAVQISDAWKSGTFGANLVQLAFNGPLSHAQAQSFKKLLQGQHREIKNMKERLFAQDRLVFEVDLDGGTLEWSQKFSRQNYSPYRVSVLEVSPDKLELKIEMDQR